MPLFQYEARDQEKMPVNGTLEAGNLRQAVVQLQAKKLTVLRIRMSRLCACGEAAPKPGCLCQKCGRAAANPAAGFLKLLVLAALAAGFGHLLHWF